jgi:hypothetical protein
MKQILILVEGQTEETFVNEVLNPYLNQHNKHLTPTIVNTKIVRAGKNAKGGITGYGQVKRDLMRLVQGNTQPVTTFFDYYGLPDDFPGVANKLTLPSAYQRLAHIEERLAADIGHRHFIPYIQLHEFEALLFANPAGFRYCFDDPTQRQQLEQICEQFPNPEEINDSPLTAPSKRIKAIVPGYNKPFQGNMIALANELAPVLDRCPHFAAWVQQLIDC